MRGNTKDYLFQQVASAITMRQDIAGLYWGLFDDIKKSLRKFVHQTTKWPLFHTKAGEKLVEEAIDQTRQWNDTTKSFEWAYK